MVGVIVSYQGKAEEVLEQAVSEICNALKVLNEHGVKHA